VTGCRPLAGGSAAAGAAAEAHLPAAGGEHGEERKREQVVAAVDPAGRRPTRHEDAEGSAPAPVLEAGPEDEHERDYGRRDEERPARHQPHDLAGVDHVDEDEREEPRLGAPQEEDRPEREEDEQQDDRGEHEVDRAEAERAVDHAEDPVPPRVRVELEVRPQKEDLGPGPARDRLGHMPQRVVVRQEAGGQDTERRGEDDGQCERALDRGSHGREGYHGVAPPLASFWSWLAPVGHPVLRKP
jgi:hypothetical protein